MKFPRCFAAWILCASAALAASCATTSPSETKPSVTGTWEGTYQATRCTGPDLLFSCTAIFIKGTPCLLRLVLTQAADGSVRGTFDGELATGAAAPLVEPLPVSGSVDSSRMLRLMGSRESRLITPPPGFAGAIQFSGRLQVPGVEISNWETPVDRGEVTLSGTFRELVAANYFLQSQYAGVTIDNRIVALRRVAP
jgi:hypothetical protein